MEAGGEPQPIGSGAFGVVLLVHDAQGLPYAMKTINLPMLKRGDRKLIGNEVAMLRLVTHPNVVRLADCFRDDTQHLYIICEFVDGGDLCQRINRQKLTGEHFSEECVMLWASQLVSALQALHQLRILHRDVKAENTLLTRTGVVKLADFGISVQLDPGRKARDVVGTPYYYCPEMCQGLSYDEKADVWSLGILLYELLELQLPYFADTVPEVMKKVLYGAKPILSATISEDARQLVADLLAKDPDKRPTMEAAAARPCLARHLDRLPTLLTTTQEASQPPTSDVPEEPEYEDDFEADG
eukprot:GGOE01002326.1.p1 GENE.GGOE01002326.1~~GGOE01002326.1.p1  ORF type:complete len:336 (+),score=67.24 GGOE01002326.1:113-1009(+)